MTVEVGWLLPGRVLYSPGTTDRDAMGERNARTLALIEAEGQPPLVHSIIDHSSRYTPDEIAQQPKQFMYYTTLGSDEVRQRLLNHPMLGWVISVATPNAGLKMAGAVASQQHNYRWHSVPTLEDAFAFLQERDVSLPDLSAYWQP